MKTKPHKDFVTPKKHLGQHFLNDLKIAQKITEKLQPQNLYQNVLEIGPGMGVLTQFLAQRTDMMLHLAEIDKESVAYLAKHYPELKSRTHEADFLQMNLKELFGAAPFGIIGNFPYNISSQIFFKVLEYRQQVPEVVGMLQKEVAERLASPPGGRDYGILSVLLQAYYDIEYCFTVHENVFTPPPKVKSAVIRLKRNNRTQLKCDEKLFVRVVKQAFSTRRKMLANALKGLQVSLEKIDKNILQQRAERLSVDDFEALTLALYPHG
jgi:16S rRNA (adenine1518-N6/adenine1519-N6)-dimethyltransferase